MRLRLPWRASSASSATSSSSHTQRSRPRRRAHVGRLAALQGFAAAQASQFRVNWPVGEPDINTLIFWALTPLRGRSRELEMNNAFYRRYLKLVRKNIVGPRGLGFQARVRNNSGALDAGANRRIEDAWRRFSRRRNFDASRQLSRQAFEALAATVWARDGEFLIRIIRGAPNEFGYALKLLDASRLDLQKNEAADPETGNRVVMGVELDELSAPIAYWLLTEDPPGSLSFLPSRPESDRHVRVDAEDIVHGFVQEWPEQVRGVPWAHAAMVDLYDVGAYRESAIVNARIGASKLGWWKTPGGEAEGDDVDDEGRFLDDIEPGQQRAVPAEWEYERWEPQYPHDQFQDFNTALLRGVASGMDVYFPTLANDQSGVNLSSMRGGLQDDREGWMQLQNLFIEQLYDHAWPDWLRWSLIFNQVGGLPLARFDRFNAPAWLPRRWRSPDPLKDSQARAIDYAMRTRSLREMAEEGGRDAEEVWQEIARDEAMLRELGITAHVPSSMIPDEDAGPDEEGDENENP